MKVILQRDIAKVGRRHEVVDVAKGYAQNHLVPNGFAVEATDAQLKAREAKDEQIKAEHEAEQAQFEDAVAKVAETPITLTKPANETGHLFAAVTPADVAEALAQSGISLSASHVHIGTPIKEVGEHTIQLVSGTQVEPATITVMAE